MNTGEPFSKSVRRQFLPVAKRALRGKFQGLAEEERELIANLETLQKMHRAELEGDFAGVEAAYQQFPPSMKKDNLTSLIRVRAASNVSEAQYIAAMNDFQKEHANDPSIDMVLLDKYFLEKNYDKAQEAVDRLDKAVGGDPHSKVLTARIHFEQKKIDTARQHANAAIAAEPTLIDAYWVLVSISLSQNDFRETASLLSTIGEKFEMQFGDLTEVDEYAEFVKSPEYLQWVKTHPPTKSE